MRYLVFVVCVLACLCGSAQADVIGPGYRLTDYKWDMNGVATTEGWGTGGRVSYSFMRAGIWISPTNPDGTDHGSNAGFGFTSSLDISPVLPSTFKERVREAFAAWSAVADITFEEVADGSEPYGSPGSSGVIRIGAFAFDPHVGQFAHGHAIRPSMGPGAGDIHFNTRKDWSDEADGYVPGGVDVFQVAVHEIGHVIGFSHNSDVSQAMAPSYAFAETFRGPQWGDIAGAQLKYGAPVPEPGTIALIGLGIAAAIALRRRRGGG